jgi:hypothetical protein
MITLRVLVDGKVHFWILSDPDGARKLQGKKKDILRGNTEVMEKTVKEPPDLT